MVTGHGRVHLPDPCGRPGTRTKVNRLAGGQWQGEDKMVDRRVLLEVTANVY